VAEAGFPHVPEYPGRRNVSIKWLRALCSSELQWWVAALCAGQVWSRPFRSDFLLQCPEPRRSEMLWPSSAR
jgi:hypothetical protein